MARLVVRGMQARGLQARRLLAWFSALPPRRQERLQDAGLALALAVANVLSLLPYRAQLHPLWLALVLVAAQCTPLTWRRAWPVGTLVAVGVPRVAYDVLGFGFAPLPLAPAIALYTVSDRSCPAARWGVVPVVAAAVGVSQSVPGHSEPYEAIFQAFIFSTAWVLGALNRARRANLQAVSSRADRAEAELDRKAAQAAAAERLRIARELHDVVAHHVSLMAVQAEAAGSLLPDRPAAAARSVDLIAGTARQAMTELRRLLGVLRGPSERPETAPPVSLAELDGVLGQVRGAGLPVELTVDGAPCPLSPVIDLTAYRIVQEALTNAIRHAPNSRATVAIAYEPGYVTVRVTDTGPCQDRRPPVNGPTEGGPGEGGPGEEESSETRLPLDRGSPAPGRNGLQRAGFGLAGIAERVSSCGGTLTVGPVAAGGFAVTARLPAQ